MNLFEILANDPKLKRACKAIGGEYWEDIYHDTILKVSTLQAAEKAYEMGYLTAYACKVAISVCNDNYRQDKRRINIHEDYTNLVSNSVMAAEDIKDYSAAEILKKKINNDIGRQAVFFDARLYTLTRTMTCKEVAVFCGLKTRNGSPATSVVKRHVADYKRKLKEYAKKL